MNTLDIHSRKLEINCARPFVLRVARTLKQRQNAWSLVYDVYREAGYTAPSTKGLYYSTYDGRPDTLTFTAERHGHVAATARIVFDDSCGLPSEKVFPHTASKLRKEGRKLCEVGCLVVRKGEPDGVELLKYLFKLAYLAAGPIEHATDMLITVVPRHAFYYQHGLLFTRLTDPTPNIHVNGEPVVLLHLDLVSAPQRYHERYKHFPPSANLHRFFLHQASEVAAWIQNNRRALNGAELERVFRNNPALLNRNATYDVGHSDRPFDPSAQRREKGVSQ